jgi:hypothetical protein
MIKCCICDKEFKNIRLLSIHISKYHKDISKEDYYNKYLNIDNLGKCKICNKQLQFKNLTIGYSLYCSGSCISKDSDIKNKKKQNNLNKYGVTCTLHNKDISEKVKKTNLEKYGVEYSLKSKDIRDKIKQTNLSKYGCENPLSNELVKEKIKQTNMERYGCRYIFQNENIYNKSKQIIKNKYNVDNISQNEDIKLKKKNTVLKNYNVEYPIQNSDIKEKIKNTNIDKYGVEYPIQNKIIKLKAKNTFLNKYGVSNYIQSSEYKRRYKKIYINKLNNSDRLNGESIPLFNESEFNTTNIDNKYKFKCIKCNNIFEDHLMNGRIPKCPVCYPKNRSKFEIEIYEYIKSIYSDRIICNDRSLIYPYELDIYIPNKRIAIEANGDFWHSDKRVGNMYHVKKVLLSILYNIDLYFIWESEWKEKQEEMKDLLKRLLCDYIY